MLLYPPDSPNPRSYQSTSYLFGVTHDPKFAFIRSSVQSRKMRELSVSVLTFLLVVVQIPLGLTFPSTVPALLWSPHGDGFSNNGITDMVNYQTLSAKDLAKSVLSDGGWSNLLCSGKEAQHPVDVALLFIGRELQSLDISGVKYVDSSYVDFLKVSFTIANFSLAFPYIAASEEEEAVESSLISEFAETCGHTFQTGKVAFLESCSLDGGNYEKLADLHTFHDYLLSRMEKRLKGQTDLVVFCQGSPRSESQILSELISSMEHSGTKYTVLYVSDPFRSMQYSSYRGLERYLAEVNSTVCDGVCQIKSSLLEGLLVGIVLLIILISGLCCMAGIDTPTRFETPQDS